MFDTESWQPLSQKRPEAVALMDPCPAWISDSGLRVMHTAASYSKQSQATQGGRLLPASALGWYRRSRLLQKALLKRKRGYLIATTAGVRSRKERRCTLCR